MLSHFQKQPARDAFLPVQLFIGAIPNCNGHEDGLLKLNIIAVGIS